MNGRLLRPPRNHQLLDNTNNSAPPFQKWYGTPPTTPLFLAQFLTYKSEAFYAGVHDWTHTTQSSKHFSILISADMLVSLPRSVSLVIFNDAIFASDSIVMISHLLTHLNPSSSENLLLYISDITRLDMVLGESSIDYMSRVQGISQHMQGITMDNIIPLLTIAGLDHNRYPGVKSCYLASNAALVNCNLLGLSGLISSK